MSSPVATDHRHAVAAGFLGWTLDAFDFFIVVFALTDIGKDLHATTSQMALAISMTLVMRPIGAFIFGLMADRYGRRLPLMLNLVFFSIIEVLSGLAPTYTSFLVLRILFGIGMGGEWGVGASLAMEKAPRHLRGLMSGFLQQGYACGNLLAALCYLMVFPHWGWRPMFFIGGLPALLAIYVRYSVKESEVWERTKARDWAHLGSSIFAHWRTFLYLFVMIFAMSLVSHGTQDMYPTFLKQFRGFTPQEASYVGLVYNVGAIFGGIIGGRYSDLMGRRRAMVTALLLALLFIPLWAYAPSTGMLLVGAFMLQFMMQAAWGVVPAHLNELTPDTVRGFLPGFAYQCGVAVGGWISVVQDALKDHMSYANAMALSATVVFILEAVVVSLGRERHAVEFGVVPAR